MSIADLNATFKIDISNHTKTTDVYNTDTNMRNYVKNDDIKSFKKNLPTGISNKDTELLFNDIKDGMGI